MSDNINHSKPIQIQASQNSHSRHRSDSQSSSDDYSPPLRTPISTTSGQPVSTSPTSPILSYLFNNNSTAPSTSPLKSPVFAKGSGTFPFSVGRSFNSPGTVPEELDEDDFSEMPSSRTMHAHSRRLSNGWSTAGPRFGATPSVRVPATNAQHERTAGLFRRLSLGGAFVKPQVSQPVPEPLQSQTQGQQAPPRRDPPSPTRSKRSATLSAPGDPRNRRAPSPMGERILKGHFDGFN